MGQPREHNKVLPRVLIRVQTRELSREHRRQQPTVLPKGLSQGARQELPVLALKDTGYLNRIKHVNACPVHVTTT